MTTIGISDGMIISRCAAFVTMSTHWRVVGLLGALHDPRLLAELAAHLLDDGAAGAADGLHRQRGEQADHHAADQQADEHVRVVDEEHDRALALLGSSASSSILNAANSTSAASAAEPIA